MGPYYDIAVMQHLDPRLQPHDTRHHHPRTDQRPGRRDPHQGDRPITRPASEPLARRPPVWQPVAVIVVFAMLIVL